MKIKSRLRSFLVLPFLAVLVSGVSVEAKTVVPRSIEHVPGEIVVKFRDESPSRAVQSLVVDTLRKKLGKQEVVSIHPFITDPSLAVVKLKDDQLVDAAMSALKGETTVEYTELNGIYHALVVPQDPAAAGMPNDPDFAKSWSLNNVGQADSSGQIGIAGDDIDVLPLWQKGITGSKKIVVAVIDTGIQWDHPDLAANLYTNPGEIPGNGVDDDHNGFIDDIHGWNFVANNNNSTDDNMHGSHCSGIIGAVGNNGVGIAGINWSVSLMPVKFLDADGGGTLEAAVNAINYATMMKVNVMSNSWGGGEGSQALHDAIAAAEKQGILFVVAAGNDGADNDSADTPTYPAAYNLPNMVSVAATDNKNAIASFSNYGSHGSVQLAAPGVNIYSTIKGGAYDSLSGTSMATPHVSGVAALLLSANPTWSYAELKDRMIKTSTPVVGYHNKVLSKGLINAYNAFYGIVPPSLDPPENLWKLKDLVLESPHPYTNNMNVTYPVTVPGAKYVRVHFDKVDVEKIYDQLTIETPSGQVVDQLSGTYSDYTSEYVKGDSLVIRLKTDASVDNWGFKVDKVGYIMQTR